MVKVKIKLGDQEEIIERNFAFPPRTGEFLEVAQGRRYPIKVITQSLNGDLPIIELSDPHADAYSDGTRRYGEYKFAKDANNVNGIKTAESSLMTWYGKLPLETRTKLGPYSIDKIPKVLEELKASAKLPRMQRSLSQHRADFKAPDRPDVAYR